MKSITLIVNPIAGGKDKSRIVSDVCGILEEAGFTVTTVYTGYAGHATELARNCTSEAVVSIGGDGTLSEVAQGLIGSEKVMGIIPCGSGDGLALHLGISRNHIKAAKTLVNSQTIAIDYGTVCGYPFFCTTGMGLDAEVSYNFAHAGTRGLKTYIVEALKIWRSFKPRHYIIRTPDGEWSGEAAMITVGNVNQWGNRAFIAPHASVTDGLLDISIIKPFKTRDIPALAVGLMAGRIDKNRHFIGIRCPSCTIERESEGEMHRDGDPCIMGRSLDIKIIPRALRILVPGE